MSAGARLFEVLLRRIHLDQEPWCVRRGACWVFRPTLHAPRFTLQRVADDHIGPERLAVLRDLRLECLGDVLTLCQHLTGQPKRLLEHKANPLPMDRRSWRV